jgi:prophage regulatory protein
MSAETLLPRREVERRVGLGRSTIYKRIAAGTFPKPVKLGASSCWVESEVEAWIQERIAERDDH